MTQERTNTAASPAERRVGWLQLLTRRSAAEGSATARFDLDATTRHTVTLGRLAGDGPARQHRTGSHHA